MSASSPAALGVEPGEKTIRELAEEIVPKRRRPRAS